MRSLGLDEDGGLANALDALSSPVRLAIARALREPRCLSEIGVAPAPKAGQERSRRTLLARQSVKEHIDRMVSAGIVIATKVAVKGRTTTKYVLDPDSLAVISQALHDLTLNPAEGSPSIATFPRILTA